MAPQIYNSEPDLLLPHWNDPIRSHVEKLPESLSLQVYPSPVADVQHFTQPGQVTLFDIIGREAVPLTTVEQDGVAVGHLPAGFYLYRFISQIEAVQHAGRFVKY